MPDRLIYQLPQQVQVQLVWTEQPVLSAPQAEQQTLKQEIAVYRVLQELRRDASQT